MRMLAEAYDGSELLQALEHAILRTLAKGGKTFRIYKRSLPGFAFLDRYEKQLNELVDHLISKKQIVARNGNGKIHNGVPIRASDRMLRKYNPWVS